jgi:hypothetical protein
LRCHKWRAEKNDKNKQDHAIHSQISPSEEFAGR